MAGPIAFYTPDPIQSTQLIPGGNVPAAGAQLFVYQVGTTTKQNSYTDPSASTARTNPIVLDSGGNIPGNGEVWIVSSAKFVLAPSNDTDPPASPYWTRDNVPGINNVAALIAASATGEWVQGSTATFVGATLFSVVGDQTALYTIGRRVKAAVTGGDRYGSVTSQALASGTTTIGLILDSGTLNGGLSSVQYGLLGTPNGSMPWTQVTSTGVNLQTVSTGALTSSSFSSPAVSTGALWNVTSVTVPSSFLTVSSNALRLSSTSTLGVSVSTATVEVSTASLLTITGGTGMTISPGGASLNITGPINTNSVLTTRNATAVTTTPITALLFSNAPAFGIFFGSGEPTATGIQPGSLFIRSDGTSATSRAYIKSGTIVTTSWTNIQTLA